MLSLLLLPEELPPILVSARSQILELASSDDELIENVGSDEVSESVMT